MLEIDPSQINLLVQQQYVSILGRPADVGGLSFWSQQLAAGVVTTESMIDQLTQSIEFSKLVSQATPEIISKLIFQNAFSREIEDEARDFFTEIAEQQQLAVAELIKLIQATARAADFQAMFNKMKASQQVTEKLKQQQDHKKIETEKQFQDLQQQMLDQYRLKLQEVKEDEKSIPDLVRIQQQLDDIFDKIMPEKVVEIVKEIPVLVPQEAELELDIDLGGATNGRISLLGDGVDIGRLEVAIEATGLQALYLAGRGDGVVDYTATNGGDKLVLTGSSIALTTLGLVLSSDTAVSTDGVTADTIDASGSTGDLTISATPTTTTILAGAGSDVIDLSQSTEVVTIEDFTSGADSLLMNHPAGSDDNFLATVAMDGVDALVQADEAFEGNEALVYVYAWVDAGSAWLIVQDEIGEAEQAVAFVGLGENGLAASDIIAVTL